MSENDVLAALEKLDQRLTRLGARIAKLESAESSIRHRRDLPERIERVEKATENIRTVARDLGKRATAVETDTKDMHAILVADGKIIANEVPRIAGLYRDVAALRTGFWLLASIVGLLGGLAVGLAWWLLS